MIKGFKKHLSVLAIIAVALTACTNGETSSPDTIHISGTVNNADLGYIQHMKGDSLIVVDTVELKDNTFSTDFPGNDHQEVYILNFPGNKSLRFIAKAGESLSFEIDITDTFLFYTVEGNTSSKRLRRQQNLMGNTMGVLDSLDAVNQLYLDSTNFPDIRRGLQETFQSAMILHRDSLYNIVNEDSTDLGNMFVFYHQVGNTTVLTPQADLRLFYTVDNGVWSAHPENMLVQNFHKNITELRRNVERSRRVEQAQSRITKGSLAPSINLPDPFGESRSLKDLRGKIVLIDFWAAWCRPCRMNNPHLVQMYEKYKNRGFDIFSVSLDGLPNQSLPREEWRNAIQQDNLAWPNHVSDLKGWESQVVTDYGISGIPFTVLIDQEGFILGTNLRGAALEEQLKIYLGD